MTVFIKHRLKYVTLPLPTHVQHVSVFWLMKVSVGYVVLCATLSSASLLSCMLSFEGDLRVYFQCDGQDRVHLPDITIEVR